LFLFTSSFETIYEFDDYGYPYLQETSPSRSKAEKTASPTGLSASIKEPSSPIVSPQPLSEAISPKSPRSELDHLSANMEHLSLQSGSRPPSPGSVTNSKSPKSNTVGVKADSPSIKLSSGASSPTSPHSPGAGGGQKKQKGAVSKTTPVKSPKKMSMQEFKQLAEQNSEQRKQMKEVNQQVCPSYV
jgi:hypothetical protein